MIVYKKIIVSGSIIECYDFSDGVFMMADSKSSGYGLNSRDNLRRLITSNLYRWRAVNDKAFLPLFLTLTYRVQDITVVSARQQYRLFMTRFARYRKKLDCGVNKYVAVMEMTKKGVPHWHLVFFNLPFIPNIYDTIRDLWGQGHIIVKPIKGSPVRSAFYMAKYLSKQKQKGIRSYLASRGLLRPIVFYNDNQINLINNSIATRDFDLVSEYSYPSMMVGEIYYRMYEVKDNTFDIYSAMHYYVDNTYPSLI